MPIAQLLPMSLEMIAFFGRPAWIARQAMRADMRSGSRARARAFQVVPASSSSWSMELSACSQADLVRWMSASRSARPVTPARGDSFFRSCAATSRASPQMPTVTVLVSPMRSALMSTWMTFARFGQ